MMKNSISILLVLLALSSCVENLMEKPDNLIPRDKMVVILEEMTILNGAREHRANIKVLKENGIDPTQHLFEKFNIDSTTFVESDRYYASFPLEYVSMYEEIEASLIKKKEILDERKKISDSLKVLEKQALRRKNDSLSQIPKKLASDQK